MALQTDTASLICMQCVVIDIIVAPTCYFNTLIIVRIQQIVMDIIVPAEMVGVSADINSNLVVRDSILVNLVVIAYCPDGDAIVVRIDIVVVEIVVARVWSQEYSCIHIRVGSIFVASVVVRRRNTDAVMTIRVRCVVRKRVVA